MNAISTFDFQPVHWCNFIFDMNSSCGGKNNSVDPDSVVMMIEWNQKLVQVWIQDFWKGGSYV